MRVRDALETYFSQVYDMHNTYSTIQSLRRDDIRLYAVGSTVNGCGSYNSDMDMCLCVPAEGFAEKYDVGRTFCMRILHRLNGALNSRRYEVPTHSVIPAKVGRELMETWNELSRYQSSRWKYVFHIKSMSMWMWTTWQEYIIHIFFITMPSWIVGWLLIGVSVLIPDLQQYHCWWNIGRFDRMWMIHSQVHSIGKY